MSLSIIIPTHNDNPECLATVRSIRATSGTNPEIIIIDDATFNGSPALTPDCGQCTLVRTERRIGVGPARHLGALRATKDWLLFVDSHSRFLPQWYEYLMSFLPHPSNQEILFCGQCLGFTSKEPALDKKYWAGTINVCGRDRQNGNRMQFLEAVWSEPRTAGPIPCVLGACYLIRRDYFLKLDPLSRLRGWGEDESLMSIKTWLSGGSVLFIPKFQVGHKFRLKNERPPFPIPAEHRLRNKLFAITTLLPKDLAAALLDRMRKSEPSYTRMMRFLESEWADIELERERNRQLFVRDFHWIIQRFGLQAP